MECLVLEDMPRNPFKRLFFLHKARRIIRDAARHARGELYLKLFKPYKVYCKDCEDYHFFSMYLKVKHGFIRVDLYQTPVKIMLLDKRTVKSTLKRGNRKLVEATLEELEQHCMRSNLPLHKLLSIAAEMREVGEIAVILPK